MRRSKHVPQRMCVVCRRVGSKRELLRLVRTPDGGATVDETGKLPGRGAYVCRTAECIEKGATKKVVERALNVRTSPETLERIKREALRRLETNAGPPLSGSVERAGLAQPQPDTSPGGDNTGPCGGVA